MPKHYGRDSPSRVRLEVSDIFGQYGQLLGPLPSHSHRVIRDITQCRTQKLGGHVRVCNHCGFKENSYNSCRNRHCPKCQFLKTHDWVEKRAEELLPISYFHVVFTIPHVLNPLTLQNKRVLYDILFKSAAQTLKDVAKRRLGAEIGFISILHTWGQNLMDHPHLHIIVPGGGLKLDKWVHNPKGYLFPVKILSTIFRAKFLGELQKAHSALEFHGRIKSLRSKPCFKNLLTQTSQRNWVVYAKKPFAGPNQVINYLGQYTHRIAISNRRLIKIKNDHVYFQYRDYAHNNQSKVLKLRATEFMRRFLLHVLPKKFVRIRHYGLLGNRHRNEKIKLCKILLPSKHPPSKKINENKNWMQKLKELTGIDLSICPVCKTQWFQEPPFEIPQPDFDSS